MLMALTPEGGGGGGKRKESFTGVGGFTGIHLDGHQAVDVQDLCRFAVDRGAPRLVIGNTEKCVLLAAGCDFGIK